MKTLITIICLLLIFSCANIEIAPISSNITASELQLLEPVDCAPLSPWAFLCFYAHEKTSVCAVISQTFGIVRYCYIDQGELVAFQIDMELFINTGELVYIDDTIDDDRLPYIKGMLNHMNQGFPPFEFELEPVVLDSI